MNKRFYLIDILRIPILFTIVWFHTYNFLYAEEYNATIWQSTWSHYLIYFMRFFSHGGQWILSISCFLIGYKKLDEKHLITYLTVFFIGIATLTVGQSDQFLETFTFEWDIYHFLFINFLIILVIQRMHLPNHLLAIIGSVVLFIPFWKFDFLFDNHSLLKKVLIGDFTASGEGGWALLPWSGLTLLYYSIGNALRKQQLDWHSTPLLRKIFALLILFLVSSSSQIYFYPCPIGPGYYEHQFKPPFFALVGVNLFLIIILQLSAIERLNETLAKNKFVHIISNLNWNRSLASTYLIHLFSLFCFAWLLPFNSADKNFNFELFDFVSIGGFFWAEAVSKILHQFYFRLIKKHTKVP